MNRIYLAGPITNLSYGHCTEWRKTFEHMLGLQLFSVRSLPSAGGRNSAEQVQCLSPMRGKEYLAKEDRIQHEYPDEVLSCQRGIMARDFFDSERADLVVVNFLGATSVSIGTVMEVAWAYAARTPVIAMMEPEGNPHDHPMMRESLGFRVTTLEAAVHTAIMVIWP